ncbi:Putative CRISPR-associated endoribonuclease Cas6 [Desulfonema limicola]|uniref:CRISPR-associated endoribonuclease Cas6 n=1 Tax=Desulfonema limicola TaxID=45656 RepID=A0A975B969_9BACT|nr:CRISPR-associated endoribonuclease Cas6 [Desulfonema limicola]QTA81100.1 Putative CRISPR-associated endoribonuclease Cas6 [Desulfonema limicola]
MPVTAIINMRAITQGTVPRSFNCLMHPVFLDRISKADASMGKKLHDSGAMSPFSISPVMGVRNKVVENNTYWIRFCILNDDLENAFMETLEKGLWNQPILLEDHIFQTENIILGKNPDFLWSGRDSYQDIVVNTWFDKNIKFRIISPMSFKKGDLHYPLPEPKLIFGNLSRRWNMFSQFTIPEDFSFENISFSNLNIKTTPYALRKKGTILGVTGKMTFIIKADQEVLHCCNTLLRFAFYSGIGVKTTQGMGMCRILS